MSACSVKFNYGTLMHNHSRYGDKRFYDTCEDFAQHVEKTMGAVVVILGSRITADGMCQTAV